MAAARDRRYAPIHDVILFYTKSDQYTWNPPKRPTRCAAHVEEYFELGDDGQMADDMIYGNVLTGSGERGGENQGQPWRGVDPTEKGRHWAIPKALVDDCDEDLSALTQHAKLDRLFERGFITITDENYWPMYEHVHQAG